MGVPLRPKVAILAEAGPAIGTGHIKESLCLSEALKKIGIKPELWTTSSAKQIFSRDHLQARLVSSLSPQTLASWANDIKNSGGKALVVNLRDLRPLQTEKLKSAGLPLIVFDEIGSKALKAALIINPLLPPSRHRYNGKIAKVLAGPRFLPMDARHLIFKRRTTNGPLRQVLVTFGGVDRTGATLRITKLLAGWRPEVKKRLVLGPGFRFRRQLDAVLRRLPGQGFKAVSGLRFLAPLIASSDVVLTAGGNTLCEAACLGVPALVAYEDRHEREQGETFESLGFGLLLGQGTRLNRKRLLAALKLMDDPRVRRQHARAGQRLVDGLGAPRVARLVKEISRNGS